MLENPPAPIENNEDDNFGYSPEEIEALINQAEKEKQDYKEKGYILTLEDAELKIENVQKAFTEAESVLELEGREKAKVLLNNIYSELGLLNDSITETNPLAVWNSNGYMTEEQFNILNLRRKKLSNDIGIMTASGVVRHDLNKLD
jgi:hypothetical protein